MQVHWSLHQLFGFQQLQLCQHSCLPYAVSDQHADVSADNELASLNAESHYAGPCMTASLSHYLVSILPSVQYGQNQASAPSHVFDTWRGRRLKVLKM